MKKKILALLLVSTMAFSIVACGSEPTKPSNDKNTEQGTNDSDVADDTESQEEEIVGNITMNDLKKNSDGFYVVTEKQLASCLEKVTLTKENWNKYFGEYEETIQEKNAFGDVEREYTRRVFGLKPEFHAVAKGVAFKFAGVKVQTPFSYGDFDNYVSYEDGYVEFLSDKINLYDKDGNFIAEDSKDNTWNYSTSPVIASVGIDMTQEYYVAQFYDESLRCRSDYSNFFFSDYECLDIKGEIIILHLPDELFEEKQVQFGKWISSELGSERFDDFNEYVK